MERISSVIDPSKIDVLIANHVEMDHSGSTPLIHELAPGAQIYCSAPQGVKNMVDWQIVTAEKAIRMASEVAARSAHIEERFGFIKPGRDADMTIFNADMTLAATFVSGVEAK